MAKIAAILTDMFEDSEYKKPVDAFSRKDHKIVNLGLEQGKIVKGKKEGTKVKIDESVKDAMVQDYDALLIPGGYSPDKLRVDDDAVQFVKRFVQSGKPVFSICHGPQLLISAEVLKGRKITGWKSIIKDIENAGAQFVDESVVKDNNIISSRNPDDIPDFIEESLKML